MEDSSNRQNPDFLVDMSDRGHLRQCTDLEGLVRRLAEGPAIAYVGFDATAPGLHVGSLVSLTAMRRFAAAGHKVIALVGGATSLVGDPSFRNSTRPMLSRETVEENILAITADILRCMGPHAGDVEIVNNADWLSEARFLDFMRDVGSAFTVSRMTSMESVAGRLSAELPVTMLEFSYMLLQAADFRHLARTRGCVLQMGGSDQWGNICNGIELARRTDGTELFGLTTPLLTTSSGEKMGKTADGAVWLSPDRLDHFSFWQFWRNCADADVRRFLAMFTDMPLPEIDRIASVSGEELNLAKRILADQVTELVRGAPAAKEARDKADALFRGGEDRPVELISADGSMQIADLVVALGFASTKGEAGRLADGGGIRIDGEKRLDGRERVTTQGAQASILSAGRRRRAAFVIRQA